MKSARKNGESGFTLLEALVSSTIFFLIISAVLVSYAPSRIVYGQSESQVDVQQNVRLAVADMAREIRMAGYFPENFTNPPISPLLQDPIRIATEDALAIYGDADNSGASNGFLYCLDGDRIRRNRNVVTSGATFVCANGDIIAENITALRFTYYDTDNDPLPDPLPTSYQLDSQDVGSAPNMTTTVQRGSVRRVLISVSAQDTAAGQDQLFTMTSDVVIRNR